VDEPVFVPATTKLAASVVLVRRLSGASASPGGLEVFWVRRGAALKFAGGFYAFAGGRVDATDAALFESHAQQRPRTPDESASIAAAARELFEETGVLAVPGASRIPREERDRVRAALVARPSASDAGKRESSAHLFGGMLVAHALRIDADLFHPAGRWITPPAVPTRFDTRFYLVELPKGEEAVVWPGELADGEWIAPHEALARWDQATALLHPPAWHILKSLARCAHLSGDPRDALAMLDDPARAPWALPIRDFVVERMEFQRGVVLVPLHTPTLPPATHTNCLLLGDDELLVVDPGSPWAPAQAELSLSLDRLEQLGRNAKGILLTHYHFDHVAGAMALSKERGLPIFAHAETAARLEGEVRIDRRIADGEELPFGPRGWRALHLPGHTRGHLCLLENQSGTVAAGDLVAGQSTVVIDPPEGDMGDYLRSLAQLIDQAPQTIYPAHGQVIAGGEALLRGTLAHRLEREAKVLAALRAAKSWALPEELVPAAYPEIAPALYPLAERSLLAHLLKLAQDGAARQDGSGRFKMV